MKKRLTFLITAFIVVNSLWAQTFQSGDLMYNVISSGESGNAVEITKGDYFNLTEIAIPSTVVYNDVEYTVTTIGELAFCSCYNLKSITIPDGVTNIKGGAFWGCDLSSITIPENVTNIEWSAFSYCRSLTSVSIPQNVTKLGVNVFEGCSNLNMLTVNAVIPPAISDKLGLSEETHVLVPEKAISNYKNAEYWKELNIMAIGTPIPSPVGTEFDYNSISYRVKENYTLEIFKNYSYDYSSLTSADIPETVTYKDYTYPVTSIGAAAFYNCENLSSVTIPNSVTLIDAAAFSSCLKLKSITIPNSVTDIGNGAFSDTNITSITIPNSVKNITGSICYNCYNLETIVVESGNTVYDSRENCNAIIVTESNELIQGCNNTVIPKNVTSIGEMAFENTSLASILIPNSVTSIGKNAFCGTSLTSITIPNSVISIGERAFTFCWNLESIIVENGNHVYDSRENCNAIIVSESNELIQGCNNTVIPQSVTSIGNDAFNCMNITSITIPNSVTSIGSMAFANCTYLTSIDIPESVTNIGGSTFMNCSELTKVTIPNSVTNITHYMFGYCSALTEFKIPENVTKLGDCAFIGCRSLKSIVIPKGVTNIGEQVFNLCPSLESIIISEGVTTIGRNMFSGCSIMSVTLPKTLTTIMPGAFLNCHKLSSIHCKSEVPPTAP